MVTNSLFKSRVKQVMSKDVVSIHADDAVHDALELMMENKVSALPVVDSRGRCVGILSTSDFMGVTYEMDEDFDAEEHGSEVWWRLFVRNLSQNVGQQSVLDLMTEDVVSTGPDHLLVEAASTMLRERIHRLPVVDGQQRLLGIVSTTDVIRAFVAAAPSN